MTKLRKVLLCIAFVLVAIQFFHPKKNIASGVQANNIAKVFSTSEEVQTILAKSCNDCHSNNTIYPWYNNIQPVEWWLSHHVCEGKEKLNFDEFVSYSPRKQYHKLEETEEMINTGKMPLSSYTLLHKEATLNESDKTLLIEWTKNIRREMENKYPMDSLIRNPKSNKT